MPLGISIKAYSLRTLLLAYGCLLALPLLVLLGVFFWRSSALERQDTEQRLTQTAADLADDIDRDLRGHLQTLRALAALPAIAKQDWPTFYAQAKSALRDEV